MMQWVIERRDEQATSLADATLYFNEEFERRRRDKEEEIFW
jgi:hypothetical protein